MDVFNTRYETFYAMKMNKDEVFIGETYLCQKGNDFFHGVLVDSDDGEVIFGNDKFHKFEDVDCVMDVFMVPSKFRNISVRFS